MRLMTLLLIGAALLPAETITRQVFDQWLETFNAADRAKWTAFYEKYIPEKAKEEPEELEFFEESGGFNLVKITSDDGKRLQALLQDKKNGTYVDYMLGVESGEKTRIRGIGLRITEPPEGTVKRASSKEELVKAVEAKAAELVAANTFSGSVLIAKDGKVWLENAWGLADRENNRKNVANTQFRVGSMNKMFTAVSILQLIDKGKMSLDGTIADYWPDYPNKDLASKVKIRHLLSHTGGTGDIFGPEFDKKRLELKTLKDYATLYGQRAVQFEPGERFSYSNYGFLLLGLLVEKVSGKDYYEYVRENIFKPSGMAHTDSLPETDAVPGRSVGYLWSKKGWAPNTETLPWRGTSAGGGYSTVRDFFRFAEALKSGKLISPKLLEEATKEQTRGAHYGFGFQSSDTGFFGHGGGAPGMNGDLRIYPKTGYVVIVLANLDPPAAQRMATFISTRLPN